MVMNQGSLKKIYIKKKGYCYKACWFVEKKANYLFFFNIFYKITVVRNFAKKEGLVDINRLSKRIKHVMRKIR